MALYAIKRIPANKRKSTDYFTGVENGKPTFSLHPMNSFTDEKAHSNVGLIADLLRCLDKKNTYEVFEIRF